MRHRIVPAAGALALVLPSLLLAQRGAAPRAPIPGAPRPEVRQLAGSWELSAGAGLLVLGEAPTGSRAAAAPGGVLRLGYNVSRSWNISAGTYGGYGPSATRGTGRTAYLSPFAAATWTPDINRPTSLFVTAGAGLVWRKTASQTAAAAHLGVGLRHRLGDAAALRGEVGLELFTFKAGASGAGTTSGAAFGSVGLSYFLGGGPPKDDDDDGVPNKLDRCPDTPRGAAVDAEGCPHDADGDGVPDGLDRCPATPAGVRVDPLGCAVDSDHDGIPDFQDRCPGTATGVGVDTHGCPLDTDGDGVPDYRDRCPDTPHGAPVDGRGCPRDSDGDGVPDYRDRCPGTARGVTVDASGCELDSDHDGVPDHLDRCPNTAPGTQVDAAGCPVERDSDGDGVVDPQDRCPNTPHGTVVYRNGPYDGCPRHELPAPGAPATIIRGIAFRAVDRHQVLVGAGREVLDTMAATMALTPNAKWELAGYTDTRGGRALNERLSRERAQAVKDYLVSRGVPAAALLVQGYGARSPVADNRTARGRAENRRIEIKRLQ